MTSNADNASLPGEPVTIVGGGMAGVEAAAALSAAGVPVRLHEMRPVRQTAAHNSDRLAEVVCSNSLGSLELTTPKGLLLHEMEALGSLVVAAARRNAVPAGSSLAVDREAFAADVTATVAALPGVELVREEVTEVPSEGEVIVATGPLTSDALAASMASLFESLRLAEQTPGSPHAPHPAPPPTAPLSGEAQSASSAAAAPTTPPQSTHLYFYDAIAPIVAADSLDRTVVFEATRYGRGDPDFLNCPLTEAEYEAFIDALLAAETVPAHDFEDLRHFEGCMPIEELASRGRKTLSFGPMRPVGLIDPRTGRRPFAVVQLRREDRQGLLYNLVGFQTKLRYGEQARVFGLIPGLGSAEFVRLGSLHRNTFLNSPGLLNPDLSLRGRPGLWFAGQITGVEGYAESAATGMLAARALLRRRAGLAWEPPPVTTMLGGLMAWMSAADPAHFQPMNSNFGLLPPLPHPPRDKREKKAALSQRALADQATWLAGPGALKAVAAGDPWSADGRTVHPSAPGV